MNQTGCIAPQQESVSRTFYVLRNTAWGGPGEFTKMLKSGGPSSLSHHTVDDATQYGTLADAVAAQKTAVALGFGSYEIVMVSRSVTPGAVKSPAKTVRRVLLAGDASTVFKYAVGYQARPTTTLWFAAEKTKWGEGDLASAILHATEGQALWHLQELARDYGYSWEHAKIVRVVEEKTPEVRTEDVVTDVLTPLP